MKFYYLVGLANLPKKMTYPENQVLYAEDDWDAYKYLLNIKDNINDWVKGGNNLLIHSSNFGNGKTTWAIKLMCKYFTTLIYDPTVPLQECRGLYINVDDLMFSYKNNINFPDSRFQEILKLIPTVPLVIWDDVGCSKLTAFEHNLLYRFLDIRIMESKSNIFTSNIIDSELEANIGPRLANRIINTCDIVEFKNPTKRKPKSRQ